MLMNRKLTGVGGGGGVGAAVGLFTRVTSAQQPFFHFFYYLQAFGDVLSIKQMLPVQRWAVADERWPLWEGREEEKKRGDERSEGKGEEIRGEEVRVFLLAGVLHPLQLSGPESHGLDVQ